MKGITSKELHKELIKSDKIMTSEEISKKIFYKPSTNGKAEQSIKEGAVLIDQHVKNQLELYAVVDSNRTFRKATLEDIIVGNTVYLLGDNNEIYTKTIEKTLQLDSQWKAFCADDGCRYGLDRLYVYN